MKKSIPIIVLLMLFFETAYGDTITIKYSGTAEPNSQVSFMAVKNDADFDSLTSGDVAGVDIVNTAGDGSYEAELVLKNAELDENRKITNYTLKSNIKDIDINDGEIVGTTVREIECSADSDGVLFVPLVETMEKFGVTMTQSPAGTFRGTGNNGDIEIIIGKDTAQVDWVDIELPAPSKYENGTAMIPAYLLEDALRTEPPVYDKEKNVLYVEEPQKVETEEFDIAKAVEDLRAHEEERRELSEISCYTWDGAGKNSVTYNNKTDIDGDGVTTDDIEISIKATEYGRTPAVNERQLLIRTGDMGLPKGTVGLISFDARATLITDESGRESFGFSWQRRTSDYEAAGAKAINVNQDWTTFYIPCYNAYYDVTADYSARIVLNFTKNQAKFEIANINIVRYDSTVELSMIDNKAGKPYHGIETKEEYGYDALWRKEAYRRIEKYRKGDTSIFIHDKDGNPIPNAKVRAEQTESDFMFGVALVKSELIGVEDGSIESDVVNNSFNTIVCEAEMKPHYILDDDGTDAVEIANECFKRHKRMRGHALMWDKANTWPFENYKDMSYEELYRAVMDYVRPTAYAFRGKLEQWDVLNEPHDCNWIRKQYGTRLYSDVFKEVHKIDPDVKLYVNEAGVEGKDDKYAMDRIPGFLEIIRQMKSEGAPIDGIGLQMHCKNYHYPQGFYHQLDECAAVVDEVAVTEYDLYNEDNTYAAEHLRDCLLATFSHPKATAFVMWGYQDYYHWRNSAPFYDRQLNEKPAKKVWDSMVNDQFKTRTEAVADINGRIDFRGFYGDYNITVEVGGKEKTFTYSLVKNGENTIDITADGTDIYALVSNQPEGDISPIEYKNVEEAQRELNENEELKYEGILLEADLRGEANKSAVADGGDLESNTDFMSGGAWGSRSGVGSFTEDSADGIVMLAKPADGADLRRRITGEIIGGDVQISWTFETYESRSGFIGHLAADGAEEYPIGDLVCDDGVYYISSVGDGIINLEPNSRYELEVSICSDMNGGQYLEYNLLKDNVLIDTLKEKLGGEIPLADILGISIKSICADNSGEEVWKLINARLKYTIHNEMINFASLSHEHVGLDESMKGFDFGQVTDLSDERYSGAEAWGSASDSFRSAFQYKTYRKYLWAVLSDNKEQSLLHKFVPPKENEQLVLKLDLSLDAKTWYGGSGKAGINLCGNTEIPMLCVEYNRYGFESSLGEGYSIGFIIRMLNSDGTDTQYIVPVATGEKNELNKNDLHVTVTLSPNGNGDYDAEFVMKNPEGSEWTAKKEGFISGEDFIGLDTLKYYSYTDWYDGDVNIGKTVCGVRNLMILKSGDNQPEMNGDVYCFEPKAAAGIDYENITRNPFDATLFIAGYTDGVLSELYPKRISAGKSETGSISVRLPEGGSEYYKLFLFDDFDILKPYRPADKIQIK